MPKDPPPTNKFDVEREKVRQIGRVAVATVTVLGSIATTWFGYHVYSLLMR